MNSYADDGKITANETIQWEEPRSYLHLPILGTSFDLIRVLLLVQNSFKMH
jgi:hypothetical protein